MSLAKQYSIPPTMVSDKQTDGAVSTITRRYYYVDENRSLALPHSELTHHYTVSVSHQTVTISPKGH
jgi:hypothetical protein